MSLSQWIPVDGQYGELPPAVGRPGALREAIVQAIKRHLFRDSPDQPLLGDHFEGMFAAFAAALSAPLSPGTRESVRLLWAALFPPAPETAPEGADTKPPGVPKAVEEAFCWTVQGLCTQLALGWLEVQPDETAATAEDDDALAARVAARATPIAPRIEYFTAVGAIAHWVRLAGWRRLRDQGDYIAGEEDARLVAAILLDAFLGACGGAFAVSTGDKVSQEGRPHTQKWIIPRSRALAKGIANLLEDLPLRFTVQPLKQPPAYSLVDPDPPPEDQRARFRIDLIGYRRQNQFLRRVQLGLQQAEHRAPAFAAYLEAINRQQAVAWRINRPLLEKVRGLIGLVQGTEDQDPALVADLSGLDAPARAALRAWVRDQLFRPVPRGERKAMVRPGEFLDSPLARRALAELCPAAGEPPPFYLPWKADYRGRIYAETPWLSPQGGDLQRALLEFARGQVLDAAGVQALRRHGANLVRRARLLADLEISDRQVVTLAEREGWVVAHEREILASAAAPGAVSFWREVASKPMQFLAFCLAYRQWRLDPAAAVHLPVQIDGTCNGLQHIAALTGDLGLARAVNVLPRADGLPGDIYSELATAAATALGQLAGKPDKVHDPGLTLANRWLAASPRRRGWISRDSAKKVVMTIPYGAGPEAQARDVLERISHDFAEEWQGIETEWLTALDDCVTWRGTETDTPTDKERRYFVTRCSYGLFSDQRRQAFGAQDKLERVLEHEHWERMRTLGAYTALAIVQHLRTALSARYPAVDAFSGWLRRVASDCEGLPLLWLSPWGFPVCQDKFTEQQGGSLSSRLGNREIRVELKRLGEKVNGYEQGNALLPNLIHSLDATHLMTTLLGAARRGVTDIGSIHDCLLCHPNDAVPVGEAVRQAFAELYDRGGTGGVPEPLTRWRAWMDLLAGLKQHEEHTLLLGALNEPGGPGERMLRWLAPADEAARRRHADLLALLERLRQLDPASQFLARQVLEYLQEHEIEVKPKQRVPTAKSKQRVSSAKPWQGVPDPPVREGLSLAARDGAGTGTLLSDYFFS